jgi:phenol 2-monooxygenase
VDETDVTKKLGGKAYESYGVGSEGAVAVIRPDGYVGNVLPLAMAAKVEEYFRGFAT